jgi:hypothetical protein
MFVNIGSDYGENICYFHGTLHKRGHFDSPENNSYKMKNLKIKVANTKI